MRLNQVTLPAIDVAASVAFYRSMGFELIVDAPHYARFKSIEGDTTFSVHKVDLLVHASQTVVYFETSSLDETVKRLQCKGLAFSYEPRDEPWLWREARLTDPSGNVLCLYWAGASRLNPPWRVGIKSLVHSDAMRFHQHLEPVTFLDEAQSQEFESFLEERIYEFNSEVTGYFDGRFFGGRIQNAAGEVIAGFTGHTWGGCCELTHMWVGAAYRGQGLGSSLLQSAEAEARRRGCAQVVLTTHSFQAPRFYEINGYERKYSIEGRPKGHSNIIYVKQLQQMPDT